MNSIGVVGEQSHRSRMRTSGSRSRTGGWLRMDAFDFYWFHWREGGVSDVR